MNKVIGIISLIIVIGFGLTANIASAQSEADEFQSVSVHVNQNKCNFAAMDGFVDQIRETMEPILNMAVEDGEILNWGLLTHSYGDEWNLNMFIVAESHVVLLEFLGQFSDSLDEAWPTYIEDFSAACTEHKDNIYRQVAGYMSPAAN